MAKSKITTTKPERVTAYKANPGKEAQRLRDLEACLIGFTRISQNFLVRRLIGDMIEMVRQGRLHEAGAYAVECSREMNRAAEAVFREQMHQRGVRVVADLVSKAPKARSVKKRKAKR